MQGFELNNFLDHFPMLKKHNAGIFAINTLPKSLKFRHFCFCNTDVHDGVGIHWFCLLRNSKDTIECFDSLGIDDKKLNVLKTVCKFRGVKELEFNETQFQPNNSNECGLFTLYFLVERMHNLDLSFDELLEEIFDASDQDKNNFKVLEFAKNFNI